MKTFLKNNPKLFVLLYVVYVILVALITGNEYSFLVQPLMVPMTILVGIFIWEWQEGLKNDLAKKEQYNKNHNEKAEKIFGIYTMYEKCIQNLYRFFTDLDITIQPQALRTISKSQAISLLIEKMEAEVKLLQGLEIELYNEAVLFYYLVSKKQPDVNVYQDATNLKNNLNQFIYVSDRISKLVETYRYSEKSQQDREMDLLQNYYRLKPEINSFNFGNPQDSKEIIYVGPRKKFLELTKPI